MPNEQEHRRRRTGINVNRDRLVRLRESVGESQTTLARRAGVSQATVNNVERGIKRPSPRTLYALATALGVTVDDLRADEVEA